MKLLLIHNYYRYYGGEDAVYNYEKELLKINGFHVVEYSKNSSNFTGLFGKISIIFNFLFSFQTVFALKKIIKKTKPDIAHLHNIFPLISPSVYYILKKNNIPIIQTIHNLRFFCSNGLCFRNKQICEKCLKLSFRNIFLICNRENKIYDFLLSLIIYITRRTNVFKYVSYFIAPSMFIRDKLIDFGTEKEKIILKHNSQNTGIALAFKSIETYKSDSGYFLFIGRLSEEKGIMYLIEAFKELRDINLVILGTGPLEINIRETLEHNKLKNIKMAGFKSGNEKDTLIKNSLAAIFSSIWYENCPVSLIESQGCGIPVIVNDIGALPEFVTNSYNGFVYEFNDLGSLKEKIIKIYNMGKKDYLTMKTNCLTYYKEIFNEKNNLEILVNLYSSV